MCIVLKREEAGLPELSEDSPEYKAANQVAHPLEPPLDRKYICKCGKPAVKTFCRGGRLENRGKWFFRCEKYKDGGCYFWEWIETLPEKCLRSHIVQRKRPHVVQYQDHYLYD
jgi:hypothetical protein